MQIGSSDERPRRRSKKLIIAVIVVAAAVIAVFAILSPYLLTFNDSGALAFDASINSTSISQNQTIRIDLSVRNSLDFTNTVPLSGNWKVQNLSMGPCASYPYGMAVYQGRYTLGNISSAAQLSYTLGPLSCPVTMIANTFTFKPHQNVSGYVDLKGYWTAGGISYPIGVLYGVEGEFHPFVPGVYTLAAGDEWGHVKLLYFKVSGISLQNFSLCPSNCTYPSPYLTGEIYLGGPSPLKTLQLIVNGTDEGVVTYGPTTQTEVILIYKGGFQNPAVVGGETYALRFVATFEDNSTSTATTTVVAA